MKDVIVICSRKSSSRLPNKAFLKSGGVPHLENLVSRLVDKFEVIVNVPREETKDYEIFNTKFGSRCNVMHGDPDCPLTRTYEIAKNQKIDNIIRVTHDKIFVDPELIEKALKVHKAHEIDYTYLTGQTNGIGFEIVTFDCLEKAFGFMGGKRTEFLSYAFKKVAKKIAPFKIPCEYKCNSRLLIDYPEDYEFMKVILGILGHDVSVKDAIKYLNENRLLNKINRLPKVTIYSCIYNGIDYIDSCVNSIKCQLESAFTDFFEVIFIDDCSTDGTFERIIKKTLHSNKNIKCIRNDKNIGLSASSNIALRNARGEYIIRLDVDDTFIDKFSVLTLYSRIIKTDFDVMYSGFIRDEKMHKPQGYNHVGGAMFRTTALNALKFDDYLRNYEGLDLFKRAKNLLKIGYCNDPIFYYTNNPNSMSNTNLEKREQIKREINEKYKND